MKVSESSLTLAIRQILHEFCRENIAHEVSRPNALLIMTHVETMTKVIGSRHVILVRRSG